MNVVMASSDRGVKPRLHQIVVVGGGAAGLQLVTKLGDAKRLRDKAEIVLVERCRTHIWKPLLHEVAAGSLDVGYDAVDYLAQASDHHFRYRIGAMTGIDRTRREVHLAESVDAEGNQITPQRSVPYDTLVIAVGSTTNDFGTPGVSEFAISLDTADQAVRFSQRPVNRFIRAHAQERPIETGQLHVSIIGAGATGTELAAELHRTTRQIVSYGLERIDPEKDLKITLIEADKRILPALPAYIADGAAQVLNKLAIDVRTNARVIEVRQDGIHLADGDFIRSEMVVWAAGVKGPDVLATLDGLEVTRNNRLIVTPELQTNRDPNVFAIGDCTYLKNPADGKVVPPRAQAAHQQASHLATELVRHLFEERPQRAYVYRDFGSLVSLGEYSTVGSLMGFLSGKGFRVQGYFARLMHMSLYKMNQIALRGPWKVALETMAHMLTRRTAPRVKLHYSWHFGPP